MRSGATVAFTYNTTHKQPQPLPPPQPQQPLPRPQQPLLLQQQLVDHHHLGFEPLTSSWFQYTSSLSYRCFCTKIPNWTLNCYLFEKVILLCCNKLIDCSSNWNKPIFLSPHFNSFPANANHGYTAPERVSSRRPPKGLFIAMLCTLCLIFKSPVL